MLDPNYLKLCEIFGQGKMYFPKLHLWNLVM